jgi:hypothetical protein
METKQLLEHVRSEITRRALPQGGWSSAANRQASVEVTCLALMGLRQIGRACDLGRRFLLHIQNTDGSWPAFQGDDAEGCWTTSLAVITLLGHSDSSAQRGVQWLIGNTGRESHWFWNLKFRVADRKVQLDPSKFGWPWFSGTVSWVIPTAFALIALKHFSRCCPTKRAADRIQVGTAMLNYRGCPDGGWNAGNGVVLGSPLKPHIDPTSIALLALNQQPEHVTTQRALDWLRMNVEGCRSPYSIAWATLAFAVHEPHEMASLAELLSKDLLSGASSLNTDTLSVAAIALGIAEGEPNPFDTVLR